MLNYVQGEWGSEDRIWGLGDTHVTIRKMAGNTKFQMENMYLSFCSTVEIDRSQYNAFIQTNVDLCKKD